MFKKNKKSEQKAKDCKEKAFKFQEDVDSMLIDEATKNLIYKINTKMSCDISGAKEEIKNELQQVLIAHALSLTLACTLSK